MDMKECVLKTVSDFQLTELFNPFETASQSRRVTNTFKRTPGGIKPNRFQLSFEFKNNHGETQERDGEVVGMGGHLVLLSSGRGACFVGLRHTASRTSPEVAVYC